MLFLFLNLLGCFSVLSVFIRRLPIHNATFPSLQLIPLCSRTQKMVFSNRVVPQLIVAKNIPK
jgi:hypothetical protein